MSTTVKFLVNVPSGDPMNRPCTILGKKANLESVGYEKVAPFLGNRVTKEVSWLDSQNAENCAEGIQAIS